MKPTDTTLQNPEPESPDFTESDADAKSPLASQEKKGLSFFSLADVPEVYVSPWLVKGIIPLAGIGVVYGESSSGKTFFVVDLALTIAGGNDFFGRKVKQRPVIYFCLEGKEGFMNRLAAWKKMHEVWPPDIQFNTAGFNFFTLQTDEIAKFPKNSVIIIDTLNATDPTLDENKSNEMGSIITQAKEIQAITGGLILFIHHCGKDVTKGPRGHSSLMAAADVGILIENKTDNRSWKITKNKDGKSGISGNFTLQEIQLGVDEDGESITSCVVKPSEDLEAPVKKLSPAMQKAFTTLEHALFEAGKDKIPIKKWQEKWEQECPVMRKKSLPSVRNEKESNRVNFTNLCKKLKENGNITINQGIVGISSNM